MANTYVVDDYKNLVRSAKQVIYGFHIQSGVSDPALAVTYLSDCDNASYSPAYMDYDAGEFVWGDWTKNEFFMPRPCMVKYDGTVDYYLNPNDYTRKEGGTSSDVANLDYEGNAMMEWGRNGTKIWYSMIPDSDDSSSAEVRIANYKVDDTYHCWSFINENNEEVDHFYTPIYHGYYDGTRLRSISGYAATGNLTADTQRSYAQANGDGWDIECYADYILVTLLLTLMCKSLDTQTAYGNSASTYTQLSGTMNSDGLFYGENTNTTSTKIKVFGMEYWWGSMYRRMNGFLINNYIPYIKLTKGTADGSTVNDYSTSDEDGYITSSTSLPSSGYITAQYFGEKGFMYPSTSGGTSSTYYSDYVYTNSGGTYMALFGNYVTGSYAARHGAWFLFLDYYGSDTHSYVGCCLSLKPIS